MQDHHFPGQAPEPLLDDVSNSSPSGDSTRLEPLETSQTRVQVGQMPRAHHGEKAVPLGIVVMWSVGVIVFAAGNVLAGKARTVPWAHFAYFTTIMNSIVYVPVYGLLFLFSACRGHVSWEMLRFLKSRPSPPLPTDPPFGIACRPPVYVFLMVAALCDTIQGLFTSLALEHVNGPLNVIMHELALPAVFVASFLITRLHYSAFHIVALMIVLIGALISVFPAMHGGTGTAAPVEFVAIGVIGFIIFGFGYAMREMVFEIYNREMRRSRQICNRTDEDVPQLNIFVVKLAMAFLQVLCLPLLMPFSTMLNQTLGLSLTKYIQAGLTCLGSRVPDALEKPGPDQCVDAWQVYAVYIALNCAANVCFTGLLSTGGSVMLLVATQLSVPISAFLFTITWPWVPGEPLPNQTLASLIVVSLGSALYVCAITRVGRRPCCWPLCK